MCHFISLICYGHLDQQGQTKGHLIFYLLRKYCQYIRDTCEDIKRKKKKAQQDFTMWKWGIENKHQAQNI